MELTEELKEIYIKTAKSLEGSKKRMFMGRVVKLLGRGGASKTEKELGWSRPTINKGIKELETGAIKDNFSARGRKRLEEKFPKLLEDIKKIVDSQSQADPTFKTKRLYTRISVREVRKQLVLQFGYDQKTLPCAEAIRLRVNKLGYYPGKVNKCKPQKK